MVDVFSAKPCRIEIVWRRFARCRIEHAIERRILVEGSHGVAIEMCVGLCGARGDGFSKNDGPLYRRCGKCIAERGR